MASIVPSIYAISPKLHSSLLQVVVYSRLVKGSAPHLSVVICRSTASTVVTTAAASSRLRDIDDRDVCFIYYPSSMFVLKILIISLGSVSSTIMSFHHALFHSRGLRDGGCLESHNGAPLGKVNTAEGY